MVKQDCLYHLQSTNIAGRQELLTIFNGIATGYSAIYVTKPLQRKRQWAVINLLSTTRTKYGEKQLFHCLSCNYHKPFLQHAIVTLIDFYNEVRFFFMIRLCLKQQCLTKQNLLSWHRRDNTFLFYRCRLL